MTSAFELKYMEKQLKGKDFLAIEDFSTEEIDYLLEQATKMKKDFLAGGTSKPLEGKTLGMVFEKNSTRTRISFDVGMFQLGGHALMMNPTELQIGRGESIADTAKVFSEYLDGVMIRANSHEMVKEFADNASIPVINGLTDKVHPCQALADLLTIQEVKGKLAGLKLVYIGDGNNVAHSLLMAAAKMGIHTAIATPVGYEMDGDIATSIEKAAKQSGVTMTQLTDPVEAAKDADILYTDVWISMGDDEQSEQRLADFEGFEINDELAGHAKSDYTFMHCLPAHRGQEVSASVIDGTQSVVFQQAGNRLHAQKALLAALL
ncbi:ornithine carbamoyltransferase [Sporosarcina sp. BI001-red]|uniref:ornithine carbamoyltransferase n=1 Tax=Sporosarcina sp. BI001-red TaxID=2282866 RepID=UPI000E23CDC5|nr:ornithine carbamoyltransferase [Sporosarcina sp. BI001-red]REB06597.1 ornithine carbamoyltransferase [Sporosarcina sp. BI001-red]